MRRQSERDKSASGQVLCYCFRHSNAIGLTKRLVDGRTGKKTFRKPPLFLFKPAQCRASLTSLDPQLDRPCVYIESGQCSVPAFVNDRAPNRICRIVKTQQLNGWMGDEANAAMVLRRD